MVRESRRWDGSLAGNNFRLKRSADSPAYRKVGRRSEGVPFQDLSNNRGMFSTRGDTRAIFQTSWARGSFWNKPLLSDASMDTYFDAEGFDLITEPGNMVAMPDSSQQASSSTIHLNPLAVQVAHGEVYYPEASGTNQGLVKWDGSAFSTLTNDTSIDTQTPLGMCWDSKNNAVYTLFDNGEVGYVTPDSAGGLVYDVTDLDDVAAVYPGANIFMHFGRLFVWTGDVLVEITSPLATASVDEVQTIDLDSPSSGTFTITFGGQTTAAIAYNASAAAVDTALELLSNINTVTVVLNATSKWTVTFTDVSYGVNVPTIGSGTETKETPLMTINFLNVSGGAGAIVTRSVISTDGPGIKIIYDDGMGPDMATEITANATDPTNPRDALRLAVASSEGIWIVKNVNQEGVPTPFITRIDRTNDGTDIGIPVSSLPPNTMVLDLAYHLGGLVLSAATNMQRVFDNDISASGYPTITLYSLIGESLAVIGSPLGGVNPVEAPYKFLATDEARLYFGGNLSVWVYDAARGGVHRWAKNTYAQAAGGTFMSMVFTTDSAGDEVQQFSHYGSSIVLQQPTKEEGGGTVTHSLESNYFDFNIPAEQKTITHVTLMTDGVGAGETWTISLETDDGAFASVATATSTTANTAKQRLSAVKTGFRFRYKIVWAGSDIATPSKVKGIVFHALQGEMVVQWALSIDGTEFMNVENLRVRPDDVLTYLESIAGTATVVSFVDEYRTTSSTHNVKVESVTIERTAPQEIDSAQIVLTEDT